MTTLTSVLVLAGLLAISSRVYRLKNGTATIRIKVRGITSRGKTVRCSFTYSCGGDVTDGYSRDVKYRMKLK